MEKKHYLCSQKRKSNKPSMPRAPRHTTSSGIYHGIIRGVNRMTLNRYFRLLLEKKLIAQEETGHYVKTN